MVLDQNDTYCIGIDVGSSGFRLQLSNTKADNLFLIKRSYDNLNDQIWDENGYFYVSNAYDIILSLLKDIQDEFSSISIYSLAISSIEPLVRS